ncbi:ArnT family glycosyltransferase [Subtercola endophyticus]|uniref:ArnT family glycosyltransferase n=1 Tax=Subtercola endophyticus TaxID=2895559 RepID=UPI001E593573|nr:glycosyltransferase family 39 protein [Subtercola endophyticus]UFS59287.1 glycosyltransferase family 39 protein [Subtercola endophyticus]
MATTPVLNSGTAANPPSRRGRAARRLLVGDRTSPVWARPGLIALLVVTAALYLWNLGASGFANTFYAAAVQAGSESWKALFFGSLDASNFITVDKPPASLWVMGLSARLFGFSAWSLLVPQALMGVASVALLYGAVRRSLVAAGPKSSVIGGLLAGTILAFTPAAALMFRFDNPDALLTLLMTAAAYFVVRALPRASYKWLALAGVALGFAFLTKMLQGLLVLPAFGLVYLVAAPTALWKRFVHLLVAAGALVVTAGWWVLAVALWPVDARPYIGGSTNNTVLDLVFGYNGLGRIFGGSGNGGGGAGGGTGASGSSFGGATGLQRLFSSEMGLEISWLLPAAIIALVLGLIVTRRGGRTNPLRSGLLLWGGWLVVTGLVFSSMSGTIHPYYTVALAPAIGGLVALGAVALWRERHTWLGRLGLASLMIAAGVWAFVLLGENATWLPWLRWMLVVGSVLSAAGYVVGTALTPRASATAGRRGAEAGRVGVGAWARRLTAVAVIGGALFGLDGTAAYAVATASVAHSGSIPTVGSASASGGGGGAGGNGAGGGQGGGAAGSGLTGTTGTTGADGGTPPNGSGGQGGTPPDGSGTTTDSGTTAGSGTTGGSATTGTAQGDATSGGGSASGTTDDAGTGTAGTTSSADLDALLAASPARWAAAVDGSQSAATLELSSGAAVMAIGGWSDDPTPTLAEFQAYVAAGDIGYYIVSGQGGAGGGAGGAAGGSTSTASAIQSWVESTYTATTVGAQTVYDLTAS